MNACIAPTNSLRPSLSAAGRSEPENHFGHTASRLVLGKQGVHQRYHLPGLLEAREDMVFLGFLVVVLDEVAHNRGRIRQNGRVKILACAKSPDNRFIDQKHAVKHTVLAHQVFRRRNRFFFLFVFFILALPFMFRSGGSMDKTRGRNRDEAARDGQAGSGVYESAFRQVGHETSPSFERLIADVAICVGSKCRPNERFQSRNSIRAEATMHSGMTTSVFEYAWRGWPLKLRATVGSSGA